MNQFFIQFFILICIFYYCNSQNLRQKRQKNRKSKDVLNHRQSLTINYPLNFFGSMTKENWRTPAFYDQALVNQNEQQKKWTEVSYAQDGEDIWLYENWFYGMRQGVIMESGALDGILFSNSYMFETFANWTALHVEADPENYNNLISNRAHAINVNCALCNEPQLLHYSSEGVLPVRGFIEFMSPSFIKKWHKNFYNNRTKLEDLPSVQCVRVNSILSELRVNHIDIWILDIEGAEESVLRGMDFSSVRINAVAMECDEHDITKNARKTDILEANGFKCQLVERNCMCKNKLYTASVAPQKTLLRKWDGNKWADTYNSTAAV